jgi:hypothetical protein
MGGADGGTCAKPCSSCVNDKGGNAVRAMVFQQACCFLSKYSLFCAYHNYLVVQHSRTSTCCALLSVVILSQ